jgi:hypothetical protein
MGWQKLAGFVYRFRIGWILRQMEVNMKLTHRFALAISLTLLCASLVGAQGTTFQATLTGKDQNPPIETIAHGTASFTLSDDGSSLNYTISVVDTADITMAHIHIAAMGQNGPVATWLCPTKSNAAPKPGKFTGVLATGTITAADLVGPLQGKTIADLVTDIKAGNAYVNIHTTANPSGEIRGQIQ